MQLFEEPAAARRGVAGCVASGQVGRGKNALRIHGVVPKIVVDRAVELVGAALGNDVDDAAHGSSEFS